MTDVLDAERRWGDLEALQEHYTEFRVFLYDVMTDLLGFNCTDIQLDIAAFLQEQDQYKMIQAQRGQAKTTITACYAVWRLIHDPRTRILIVSAGADLAMEIANWIIQIIMQMPELECMRPDTQSGDRSSVKAFDIHHVLKGAEKSPSVACIGITSNIQGRRADLLIADDIESQKNAQTALQRERLMMLTRDFSSICSSGDIIYLGTPQHIDSIYNSLPSRGFKIRIWPGRYPTKEELENYHGMLAPLILKRINDNPGLQTGGGPTGQRGKPIDPVLLGEDTLTKKEVDQGPSYFQLQHMLDTKLMDADRYPLKLSSLVFMDIPPERCPVVLDIIRNKDNILVPPMGFPLAEPLYSVQQFSKEFSDFTGCHMYVDPAGGGANGDELAYAVTKFLAGNIYVVDAGGIPGGYSDKELDFMTAVAVKWKPQQIDIEENYGNGAFRQIWTPKLLEKHKCGVGEVWESGQKELRIIDILEPVIASNKLIVDTSLLEKDWNSTLKYPGAKRSLYSLFFQIARITRDKGSLSHDDRLDALAGSCRFWVNHLSQDKAKVQAAIKELEYRKLMSNPLGNGRPVKGWKDTSINVNLVSKIKGKHG